MPTSTWTDMVDFTAGGVVTEGTCNTYLTNNLTYVKSHIDGTAAVHGLPGTTFPLGLKASGGGGAFIQYCTATTSSNPGNPETSTLGASFPVPFSSLLFYSVNCVLTGGDWNYVPYSFTVTVNGGSCSFWHASGKTRVFTLLGIGT